MFTFGREREKENAHRYFSDTANYSLIDAVIDVAHDCVDGTADPKLVQAVFREAFNQGGSGVWEQTGSWLGRLCKVRPEYSALWDDFAAASKIEARFRAAAFIDRMPQAAAIRVLDKLSRDPSKKIRLKVAGDLSVEPRSDTRDLLADWLDRESDSEVQDEIRLAQQRIKEAEQVGDGDAEEAV